MIRTENLAKSFNGRGVVKDLSLEAPDAAITGLLGQTAREQEYYLEHDLRYAGRHCLPAYRNLPSD